MFKAAYFNATNIVVSNSGFSRDNRWLRDQLESIWKRYFPDVEKKNTVMIKFGRWAKYQFGVISYDKRKNISTITINRMFAQASVPVNVVEHTIAHELVHYSHGFSSPHKRQHRYPHHGGIVNKDLVRRGLGDVLRAYKLWLHAYRKSL